MKSANQSQNTAQTYLHRDYVPMFDSRMRQVLQNQRKELYLEHHSGVLY